MIEEAGRAPVSGDDISSARTDPQVVRETGRFVSALPEREDVKRRPGFPMKLMTRQLNESQAAER